MRNGRGKSWTICGSFLYAPGRALPNSSTAFPPPGRWLVRLASNAMMFVSRAWVWWRMEQSEGQLEVGGMGGNLPKPSPSRDNERDHRRWREMRSSHSLGSLAMRDTRRRRLITEKKERKKEKKEKKGEQEYRQPTVWKELVRLDEGGSEPVYGWTAEKS